MFFTPGSTTVVSDESFDTVADGVTVAEDCDRPLSRAYQFTYGRFKAVHIKPKTPGAVFTSRASRTWGHNLCSLSTRISVVRTQDMTIAMHEHPAIKNSIKI